MLPASIGSPLRNPVRFGGQPIMTRHIEPDPLIQIESINLRLSSLQRI